MSDDRINDVKNEIGRDGLKPHYYDYNLELYGEMVPSYFNWMTPDEQRVRVDEINSAIENVVYSKIRSDEKNFGFRLFRTLGDR